MGEPFGMQLFFPGLRYRSAGWRGEKAGDRGKNKNHPQDFFLCIQIIFDENVSFLQL